MSLKKKLIAVAAVGVMAAAAIYGSTLEMRTGEETERDFFLSGNKETIYFWYSDETLTNYVNSAAVSFGEKEGVRVIPVLTSDSEYLEAINQASLKSEQVPDMYLLSNDSLGKAYLAGLASEIMDGENMCSEEHFPQTALSAVTYQNKYIGYPLSYDTSILVYNATYLEEWAGQQAQKELEGEEEVPEEASEDGAGPEETVDTENGETETSGGVLTAEELVQKYREAAVPATVDDILNIADTFDVPEGVEGIMKWDVSDVFYNYWFVGNYMIVGGDSGENPGLVNINNEETTQCLEVYKALNQFFSMESDTITYDSVMDDFINGRIVFTIATTDSIRRLEEAVADGSCIYQYGVTTVPDVSTELKSRSMSVTNAVVINGYSSHKQLANQFARYLTGEYASNLYERTGKVPALLSANEKQDTLQAPMKEYADSVPLPKMMETGNFWMHLEVLFAKIWNGEDVPAALQQLSDQMAVQMGNVTQAE